MHGIHGSALAPATHDQCRCLRRNDDHSASGARGNHGIWLARVSTDDGCHVLAKELWEHNLSCNLAEKKKYMYKAIVSQEKNAEHFLARITTF